MGPSSKVSLRHLVYHVLSPSIAQLRPKGQFALKVWKNWKNSSKIENPIAGFEPAMQ